jgi:hypothetical protein
VLDKYQRTSLLQLARELHVPTLGRWPQSAFTLCGLETDGMTDSGRYAVDLPERAVCATCRRELDRIAAGEAMEAAWRWKTSAPGPFTVTLHRLPDPRTKERVGRFLGLAPNTRDLPASEIDALLDRVVHLGPQSVAEGIAQANAAELKTTLEAIGAQARMVEGAPATGQARPPIPQKVRDYVWRRDGGACVDCGSRQRLEYDYIIPLGEGGSYIARNVELRCESCRKARI